MKKLQHTHPTHKLSSKEPQDDGLAQSTPSPRPQGIGLAVAFDWGIAVQILVTPLLPLFLNNFSIFKSLKVNSAFSITIASLISLPFAALCVLFGEGIRRGWRRLRPFQIGFNILTFFLGLASFPRYWQSSRAGNYWPIVTAIILLIFSPLIVWRLSRPATASWFATVNSTDARKRHSGSWLFFIILWAIIGGVLQAIAALRAGFRISA